MTDPVERTTRPIGARTGLTKHNDRYNYAPMTHPAVAQNTFICVEDGTVVYDLEQHDAFHLMLDGLFIKDDIEAEAELVKKLTEPLPRTPRAKKVVEEDAAPTTR